MPCAPICLRSLKDCGSQNWRLQAGPVSISMRMIRGNACFIKKYPSPNFLKYTNFCHPLTTLKLLIPIMRCCWRYVLPFGWKKRLDRIKALMDGKMNIFVMLKKTGMNGENPLKNMMTMIHSHFHYLMAKRMGATPAVKKNHIKNIFPAKNIIY